MTEAHKLSSNAMLFRLVEERLTRARSSVVSIYVFLYHYRVYLKALTQESTLGHEMPVLTANEPPVPAITRWNHPLPVKSGERVT